MNYGELSDAFMRLLTKHDALHIEHAQTLRELNSAREKIARIMAGLEGCCMTCEPVGVRNQQMERDIADLKACVNASADQVRAQHAELETLKAERDEARRWCCQRSEWLDGGDGTQTASEHGWDCFKEEARGNHPRRT